MLLRCAQDDRGDGPPTGVLAESEGRRP